MFAVACRSNSEFDTPPQVPALLLQLNDKEARVIGCLIEKSIVTPDQYPMTLNALTSACNQKSSRDPVMALKPGEIQQTVRQLEAKHLVRTDENFKSRTEKYSQRFCNTRYSNIQFDDAQFAIVCLLLLRGAQTPGELRSRSGRLHTFADTGDVVVAINSLIEREGDAMLVKLPRTPGRKDSEYMHLFSGEVDIEAHASQAKTTKTAPDRVTVAELAERVSALEAEVVELKKQLD
jgi:uncharacterized protein YceH (UPF0502 family)